MSLIENWLNVAGYPYQVSNLGNVRSKKTNKLLKPYLTNRGYLTVGFWTNGKKKRISVHRLVASAFLPNPDNLPQVNHIDCNKTNNCVSNLEWVSGSTNITHAYKTGLMKQKLTKEKVLKLFEYRKQGMSLRAVGKLLGVSHTAIWEVERNEDNAKTV